MAEPWLIRFFACNREMQPFSFFFCWLFVRVGSGQTISGSSSCFQVSLNVINWNLSKTLKHLWSDLRWSGLCWRRALLNNGLSLKSLAADLLNITLDKSLELRCSNWEADVLSQEQVRRRSSDGASGLQHSKRVAAWLLSGHFSPGTPRV